MGAVTPTGAGVDRLWEQVASGRTGARRIGRFDVSNIGCRLGGEIVDFDPNDWLHLRVVKRTARFTQFALVAATMAVEDAGLRIGDGALARAGHGAGRASEADGASDRTEPDGTAAAPDRVAVTVGNVLGGWDFAEEEIVKLWTQGPRFVSPYLATAWFPTAPQGNITITFGIKGRARTFVCDRASSAYALLHAADAIRRGHADVAIAGGTEQPLSATALLCCETSGYLTRKGTGAPEDAYRPFQQGHCGLVVGEGSAFVVLESEDHARRRGARIHGVLEGWATTSDGYMPYYTVDPRATGLVRAVRAAMSGAGISPADVDFVVADGSGVPVEDSTEVLAIKTALDGRGTDVPVTAFKPATTHLLGAANVADVVLALRAMQRGAVPPIANFDTPAPGFDLNFVRDGCADAPDARHALVLGRGMGGVNVCLSLGRA